MSPLSRRIFIKESAMTAGAFLMKPYQGLADQGARHLNPVRPVKITISRTGSNFEREPLIRPFGFKGGYMTEIWQTVSFLESSSGVRSTGLCTQSVLWSDANIFSTFSESGGNALMYAMTERALQIIKGQSYYTPVGLLENLYPEIYEYGKRITENPGLRKTFALNALVGVDNAAWLLYSRENGIKTFDEMIPAEYRASLSNRHNMAAAIPLMAYTVPVNEIKGAAHEGYFFMKIKIGQPGTQEEMLQKDMERLTEIHNAIGHIRTAHTKDGKLPYYFDANGRYEKKETLMRLLDHAKKIGAFDQIAIIEEPFPEEYEGDISDIPVRLASDESVHTDEDAVKRIEMGYRAIAVKAIAKTLSMTMKIVKVADEKKVPCFCADLTVNPVLVEWNKNVAARLAPFPGIGEMGLLESNGHQNYRNWDVMMGYHPRKEAPWVKAVNGIYYLNEEFYNSGGGIFDPIPHYEEMFH